MLFLLLFSTGGRLHSLTATPPSGSTTAFPSLPSTLDQPLIALPAESQPLSGDWRFAPDPNASGESESWFAPGFDDAPWTVVTVPHTWNVMPDYAQYSGTAWYRRHFTAPLTASQAQVRLRFEAVFYLARVWLNGVELGAHEGGYTPFDFDISALVKPGEDNLLAVQVDNRRATNRLPATSSPAWSFDWWNYGGIVRDVALQVISRAFIDQQRIVAVPHLTAANTADRATVQATVKIRNTSTAAIEGVLAGDIIDDTTDVSVLALQSARPVNLPAGDSTEIQLTASLSHPQLWHFDHPHLYRWSAALRNSKGEVLHTAEVTFGVRAIEMRQAQLYLNGEPVRLVGLTRHADSPEHGLAERITVMAADYDALKTLNTALTRPVHYPQSEFIVDYADRHGILLIPEVPAWQLNARQMADPQMRALERQQLREMITSQWNHPSVWAWSVANEIKSKTPQGHAFVREMIAYVKSLDPTRPVGFASNNLGSHPEDDATALSDFVMMNAYFGTWGGSKERLGPALDAVHASWPDKPLIISEYGFEPRWQRLRRRPVLTPARFYLLPESMTPDSDAADELRQQLIGEQLAEFRQKPFVAGAIFWTYQDYRTPTQYHMGVVDPQRQRRGSWAVLRHEYAPALIDSISFAPSTADRQSAVITLRARGPVERDMPAYTLWGYTLHWQVVREDGQRIASQGEVAVPRLAPGTTWSTEVQWPTPSKEDIVTISLVRPTGFTVFEQSYPVPEK